MARLEQAEIDRIRNGADIVDVISHYTSVQKHGRQYRCICPFHDDHDPSLKINTERQIYKCFVCGAGGDLITFTAKLHGLSNIDACKKLDQDFHLGLSQQPMSHIDRLKADRERAKRQAELKRQKEIENLIQRTGLVLASYHCYLWQGKQLYPYEHIRHIRALQELTQAQYYLDCYDENPREYSIAFRKQVGIIERRLHQWHNENE